jgi:hypothetical protein
MGLVIASSVLSLVNCEIGRLPGLVSLSKVIVRHW